MLRKIILLLLIILCVLWTGVIFSNSLATAEESAQQSATVTEKVNEIASAVGIEKEITTTTVRDMAHFSEFALLSALICATVAAFIWDKYTSKPFVSLLWLLLSAPICFVLACIDELLQKLSPGRVSDYVDVLLDSLGGICGILFFSLIYTTVILISVRRKRKAEKK